MHLKRAFLYAILTALGLGALGGIFAILGVLQGEGVWRVIVSMMTIALCGGVALAAFDVMEKQVWRRVMLASLAADGAALLTYLFLIWFIDLLGGHEEWVMKPAGLLAIASIAPPLAGQVMALPLSRGMTPLRLGSVGLVAAVAGLLALAIVLEIESESYYQFLGILLIVMVFAAVALRLAQRVQTLDREAGVETTALAVNLTCPRCLLAQTVPSGRSRCARCRLRFSIEIEEPRCPQCDYVLHMLTEPRCPECGHALAAEEIASA